MKDVGSRNPRASCVIFPNNFWLRYSSLYFLAMASLSPLRMMASCQRRRVIQGWGEHVGCLGYPVPPLTFGVVTMRRGSAQGWNGNSCCARPNMAQLPAAFIPIEKGGMGTRFFSDPLPSCLGFFDPFSNSVQGCRSLVSFPYPPQSIWKMANTIKLEKTFLSVSKNIFHVWGKLRFFFFCFEGWNISGFSLCSSAGVYPNRNRWDLVCSEIPNSRWALKSIDVG